MEILIPQIKFEEMASKVCCQQLIDGYIPNTVFYLGVEYAITGSFGSKYSGDFALSAYRVVHISKYKEALKPLEYHRHFIAVSEGERERSYTGMLTKHGRHVMVFVGQKISFRPSQEGAQTTLF